MSGIGVFQSSSCCIEVEARIAKNGMQMPSIACEHKANLLNRLCIAVFEHAIVARRLNRLVGRPPAFSATKANSLECARIVRDCRAATTNTGVRTGAKTLSETEYLNGLLPHSHSRTLRTRPTDPARKAKPHSLKPGNWDPL